MEDRFKVRGWSIYDGGYYDDVQDMLFGEEDNMTLLDAISKGLVSEIIPEQCTGLKDKNGKLIYEGDLLKSIYTKKTYVIVSEKHFACFSYKYKSVGTTLSEGDIANYELEVVGNIHETPELLEG